jgi:GxxExxY protein
VDENQIGRAIVDCALTVHRTVGPGLLESAYEGCLGYELEKQGLRYQRQLPMPVVYDGHPIELGYRLDLLVEDKVVVEIKSVEQLLPVHRAQLLSYLRLSGFKLGFLLNFNVAMMREGTVRLVNGL